jgi:saccharopine dehydrogenase-like NADP-dependent oxidoreductase
MRLLLDELRFRDHPAELVQRLAYALLPDDQDRVLIHASVQGKIRGRLQTRELALDYKPILFAGKYRTAIAWTTAASVAAVVELVSAGVLPQQGFVKQEEIPLEAFLDTTTGKLFAANHPALRQLSTC